MESTSSSLLLRLHRPGEQAAWNRFADLYTPLLLFWAGRMGLSAPDARDLVQDVFVTLIQKLPQFQYQPGKGTFRSWLRTVAENRWRDSLRKRAAAPQNAGPAPLEDVVVPDGAAAVWETEYRQHLIGRAMQIMQSDFEAKTWKACWAVVVDGRSGAEVAADLGLTIEAVYAARSRVLRRLRQELSGL
ncbi:MAG TPA: sigma-70 family RNA polymerase sigma factor, partial [Gemmataceae bacterium]|nr:sigma-70 family RNA polymerase sigma factor [Gemmataceae bacterium]